MGNGKCYSNSFIIPKSKICGCTGTGTVVLSKIKDYKKNEK